MKPLQPKYGRLTIIGEPYLGEIQIGKKKSRESKVMARCVCGKVKEYRLCKLKEGDVIACGCHKGGLKHGFSKHPLFTVWVGMKDRCYNQNHANFKNWGGRGITVCDEWREDSSAFFQWAINNGYRKGLALDRRDNNGNYEPSNCRFVTQTDNNRNRRNNKLTAMRARHIRILYKCGGRTYQEVADLYGVSRNLVKAVVSGIAWKNLKVE